MVRNLLFIFILTVIQSCGAGGGSGDDIVDSTKTSTPISDTTPDAFSFSSQTNQELNTQITSNTITLSGMDASTTAILTSLGSAHLLINGSNSGNSGNVENGDSIAIVLTSAPTQQTTTGANLSISGVSANFLVTTKLILPDTTPDPFTFIDLFGQELNSLLESNEITLSGMDASTTATLTGEASAYMIINSVNSGRSATVSNGDQIKIAITSSGSISTTVSGSLSIDGVSDTFSVETRSALDATPDQFTFVDITNQELSTSVNSNTIILSGMETSATASITGDASAIMKVNGVDRGTSFSVSNGDNIEIILTTSSNQVTDTSGTLTISGVSDTFTATTKFIPDATPDSFNFIDVSNQPLSTVITSNSVILSGMNTTATATLSGDSSARLILNSVDVGTSTTVSSGDQLAIRLTTSASSYTNTEATLNISGVSDTFTAQTLFVTDTTPDSFTFIDVTGQPLGTVVTSNIITLSGINTSTTATITGDSSAVLILNSVDVGTSASVSNGDQLAVRLRTSSSNSTQIDGTLSISGVSDTYSATTVAIAADPDPDIVNFGAQNGFQVSSKATSNTVILANFDAGQSATVSGDGSPIIVKNGTDSGNSTSVSPGDTIAIKLTSSSSLSSSSTATFSVGSMSADYVVTTASSADPIEKIRLVWNNDPTTTITAIWNSTNNGSTAQRYFYYDTTDHGLNSALYSNSKLIDSNNSHRGMNNSIARVTGLSPATVYYFIISDATGNSERYWFKTASDDPAVPLSIIAGGDSRGSSAESPDARKYANKTVARFAPDFVYFGGDFINSDSSESQWQEWFDDWHLTFRPDGRITPIVPARGNHDSGTSMVSLFDTTSNVYFNLTFGTTLLRTYVLNTEDSVAGQQSTDLAADMDDANANSILWQMAIYHRAMCPHYSGKAIQTTQISSWASTFQTKGMDLVVESDTHALKYTYPIKPKAGAPDPGNCENNFERDDDTGTVYIGEGGWGAPLKANNQDWTFTRDSESENQLKWVIVNEQKIQVQTVLLTSDPEGTVGFVSDSDRFTPPTGIEWWEPTNGGTIIIADYLSEISNLREGDRYIAGKTLTIEANAFKKGDTITQVEFFANGFSLGTDTTAPYTFDWTPSAGSYGLHVVTTALDASTKQSETISVEVAGISLSQSSIGVLKNSVYESFSTVASVSLKDDSGNDFSYIEPGSVSVSFSLDGSGSSSGSFASSIDNGDGSFKATFTASTAGSANGIEVNVDGSTLTSGNPSLTVLTNIFVAPDDYSTLHAWFKADSLSYNDGDEVTTWADVSGNSFTAIAGCPSPGSSGCVASTGPTFKNSVINGLPVLRFNGSNYMTANAVATDSTYQNTANGVSLFWVAKADNNQTGYVWANQRAGNNTDVIRGGYVLGNNYRLRTQGGATGQYEDTTSGDKDVTNYKVFSVVFDNSSSPASVQLYTSPAVDSSCTQFDRAIAGGDIDFNLSGRFSIGQEWDSTDYATPSDFLDGDVAELIVYKDTLSSADRIDVQNYLANKYLNTQTLSLSNSIISVSSPTVEIGASTTLSVELRDTNNNLYFPEETVEFSLSGGTSDGTYATTATYDPCTGKYSSIFTATNIGTADTISVTVNSNPITSTEPTLEVTAPQPLVAYNDLAGDTIVSNTTSWSTRPGHTASGNLTNYNTGNSSGVTLSVSESGINYAGAAGTLASGTPAYGIFVNDGSGGPYVYIDDTGLQDSFEIAGADYQDITLSGLDPAKTYKIYATMVRGNASYTNRWTRIVISGVTAPSPNHSSNGGSSTVRSNTDNGGDSSLDVYQCAINAGRQHESGNGNYCSWTSINPGADGIFKLRASQYIHSPITDGATKGYGITAIKIEEE